MKQFAMLFIAWQLLSSHAGYAQPVIREFNVLMPDGVRLYTRAGLPEGEGPFPVVLLRTPYNINQHQYDLEYFTARGYAFVMQDVRGKYMSDGSFTPFINERADGLEMVDWIERQEWFGGELFLYGSSYQAYSSMVMADSERESIRGIFNNSGWIDNNQIIHFNGISHIMLNIPWLYMFDATREMRRPSMPFTAMLNHLPVADSMRELGVDGSLWDMGDGLFRLDQTFEYDKWQAPVFHLTGWMDFTHPGTLKIFEKLHALNVPQHLVVGPWQHDQVFTRGAKVGDYDAGEVAVFGRDSVLSLASGWFDRIRSGEPIMPEIRLFNMFGDKWVRLCPGKSILPRPESFHAYLGMGGALTDEPEMQGAGHSLHSDPMDPVPTIGGANVHFIHEFLGIRNHLPKAERADVLGFYSRPAPGEISFTGRPETILYVESDAPDFDLVVQLVKTDSLGQYVYNITENAFRLSYLLEYGQEKIRKSGNAGYEVRLDLGWTSFSLAEGERLGLLISGSNFPKLERNLHTPDENHAASTGEAATIRILTGGNTSSAFRFNSFTVLP